MFLRKDASDKIETLLGTSAAFDGHLKCSGTLRVDGQFKGTIETTGNIVVGKGAQVTADLHAKNVSVSGTVTGNIVAEDQLVIQETGRVVGDVQVRALIISEGGVFSGRSTVKAEQSNNS